MHNILYHTENYVDGHEFLRLTVTEVKEMIPVVGIAKKISRLLSKVYAHLQ